MYVQIYRPTDAKNEGYRRMPSLIRGFWLISLLAFVLTVLLGYAEYRIGYPATHYNPLSGRMFDDLLEYIPTYQLLHTREFFRNPATSPVAYPPFGAVIYAVVYGVGKPVSAYLVVTVFWLGTCVWGVRSAFLHAGIDRWQALLFPLSMLLASFPIAGLLQRGNIELFLWIFAASGTFFFLREQDDVAAVLWSLAAAAKLYPVIFLVLLLPKKRYRAFAIGIASFVIACILSMKYLGPSIPVAWHGSLRNVFGYQGVRIGEWSLHELAANHSVFNLVKLVTALSGYHSASLTLPYYAAGAIVFALAFFGRLAKMPVANQLLGTTVFMVMLPPVSYFYTLVHLYAPCTVLLLFAMQMDREKRKVHGLRRTVLLFVPLFSSFMLFTFPKVFLFGGLVQGSLLIALFIASLSFPFTSKSESACGDSPNCQMVPAAYSKDYEEQVSQ